MPSLNPSDDRSPERSRSEQHFDPEKIHEFIHGRLGTADRAALISLITRDREIRLEVVRAREHIPQETLSVSEKIDPELNDKLTSILGSSNPELQIAVLPAAEWLPPSVAVPFLLSTILVKPEKLSPDFSGEEQDACYELAPQAAWILTKLPTTVITKMRINGAAIDPLLRGVKTIPDAVVRILEKQMKSKTLGMDNATLEIAMWTVLMGVQPQRMKHTFRAILQGWNPQLNDIEGFCSFAREHDLREFTEDFQRILTEKRIGQRQAENVSDLLEGWQRGDAD